MMILIDNKNNVSFSRNFTKFEIYNAKRSSETSFQFDEKLIKASQYLRDLIGEPINVNSTKRDVAGNNAVGGRKNSMHLHGKAIDLGNRKLPDILKNAIETKNKIYQDLRKMGINGFGVYDNFVHLDTRNSGLQMDVNAGSFAFWNLSSLKKK